MSDERKPKPPKQPKPDVSDGYGRPIEFVPDGKGGWVRVPRKDGCFFLAITALLTISAILAVVKGY